MTVPDLRTGPAPVRQLAIPATAGTYHIGEFRIIVRRRRETPVWLRNDRIRFFADQRGWSRTAFARHAGIDNSYTAPRIWTDAVTKVTTTTAERIRAALEVPLADMAYCDAEGVSYDPR